MFYSQLRLINISECILFLKGADSISQVFYSQLRLINISESILFLKGAAGSCKKPIRVHCFVIKLMRLIFSLFSSHKFR